MVTKTQPCSDIQEIYRSGQRDFGENRVQELLQKRPLLPSDIRWHFIGTLQRNKVKYLTPFVSLIHSVDSLALLEEINKRGKLIQRTIPCLLQVNISNEPQKHGFSPAEIVHTPWDTISAKLPFVSLRGVMGMAAAKAGNRETQEQFRLLASLFRTLKEKFFPYQNLFKEISMGMSNDYPLALQEGATIIRVGSLIFKRKNTQT